tara:strand:- start:1365 stop:1544 length:180 start_codon:yes stop_codon:yes gene_type:complete
MHKANIIFNLEQHRWGLEILCTYGCKCVENTEWFDSKAKLMKAIEEGDFYIINYKKTRA